MMPALAMLCDHYGRLVMGLVLGDPSLRCDINCTAELEQD